MLAGLSSRLEALGEKTLREACSSCWQNSSPRAVGLRTWIVFPCWLSAANGYRPPVFLAMGLFPSSNRVLNLCASNFWLPLLLWWARENALLLKGSLVTPTRIISLSHCQLCSIIQPNHRSKIHYPHRAGDHTGCLHQVWGSWERSLNSAHHIQLQELMAKVVSSCCRISSLASRCWLRWKLACRRLSESALRISAMQGRRLR